MNKKNKKIVTSYYVSNTGLVMNKEGKILKQTKDTNGYLQVSIWKNHKRYMCRVHRLVANAFIVNNENLPYVNHKNGKKDKNHKLNLEWCTPSYNNLHAYKNGLKKCGEQNKLSTHTNLEITNICILLEKGYSTSQIKKKLCYSPSDSSISILINKIKKRQVWLSISKNYKW